jgi:hypothetical protein
MHTNERKLVVPRLAVRRRRGFSRRAEGRTRPVGLLDVERKQRFRPWHGVRRLLKIRKSGDVEPWKEEK